MLEVHYQQTFFDPKYLREAAKRYLARLPKEVEVLVSTGSSGCAIATAMIALSQRRLRHVFIRKSYEMKSHGNRFVGYDYEHMNDLTPANFAVVDDFIHSGRTLKRLLRQCPERFTFRYVLVGYSRGFNPEEVIKAFEQKHHLTIVIVE